MSAGQVQGEAGARSGPDAPWPSVSVVVATRDRPELLKRAVRSILAQSYPGDIECVVVYDQTPVPDKMPAEESAGRRLRLIANQRTPGLAGARNTGMSSGTAPLIAFCDDDDAWDAVKLRRQVELLGSGPAEFVACGVRVHHGDRVIERIPPATANLSQLARDRLTGLHPSTFVFRRTTAEGLGPVDEQIPGSYGEDYDWLLRAARRMPIVSVQQPLVDVYWHDQSFFAERWETVAAALCYLLDKHPELTGHPAGLARIQGQVAFAQAALARRREACRVSWQALRNNPLERRAYLALAVASGAVSATSIVRLANRRGHGI